MKELSLIYFSPTGTTRKVVHEIAKGTSGSVVHDINLTYDFSADSVKGTVIIGSPVYAGRLPVVFKDRLKHIDLTNLKIVLVVVYGNRDYEDALLELKDLVIVKGGKVVGGGAFIGEHSLSNEKNPIAEGRPDDSDLKKAFEFGEKINKLGEDELSNIIVPGNNPYCETKPKPEVIIKTDDGKCTKCKRCINVCPVSAITKDNPLVTNGVLCLRCCACIKVCPEGARELNDPLSLKLTRMVFDICQVRKEPEIFM
jgi:flavodoxin/NAD-dependent dihydropyrimidine dehydrogenase PreA subunit